MLKDVRSKLHATKDNDPPSVRVEKKPYLVVMESIRQQGEATGKSLFKGGRVASVAGRPCKRNNEGTHASPCHNCGRTNH